MERGGAGDRFGPSVSGVSYALTIGTKACSGSIGVLLLVVVHSLGEYFRRQYLHGYASVMVGSFVCRWVAVCYHRLTSTVLCLFASLYRASMALPPSHSRAYEPMGNQVARALLVTEQRQVAAAPSSRILLSNVGASGASRLRPRRRAPLRRDLMSRGPGG